MIASVGYDQQEKILEVEFVHNGLLYEYFDVPVTEYHNLMKAASKGNYLQKCIASTYGYGRVSKPAKATRAVQPAPTLQSFTGSYVLDELLDADGQPIDAEGETSAANRAGRPGQFSIGPPAGTPPGRSDATRRKAGVPVSLAGQRRPRRGFRRRLAGARNGKRGGGRNLLLRGR
jgi:hypothetical protein